MIIVTGAESGLGKAITTALTRNDRHEVLPYDRDWGDDVRYPGLDRIIDANSTVHGLINCAGVNEQDYLEHMTDEKWARVMDTNATGIFRMSRAALPWLIESKGFIVNIVSNAAHIPMTCSVAYNASKAAALMLTKQMAHELTPRHGITVFSVSPNKLSGTGMSRDIEQEVQRTRGWTPEFAEAYQRKALLTGEETPPELVAEFIAFLLSSKDRHRFLSGCDIPYGR